MGIGTDPAFLTQRQRDRILAYHWLRRNKDIDKGYIDYRGLYRREHENHPRMYYSIKEVQSYERQKNSERI